MDLVLKPGEVRYVKETDNNGKVTYYKFHGTDYYVWRNSNREWRKSLKYKIEYFTWRNKPDKWQNWKDEFISEKDLFMELL